MNVADQKQDGGQTVECGIEGGEISQGNHAIILRGAV